MLIDETFHDKSYGCFELTRVHHVDANTVRIRVYRDFYDFQSHAVAEVLTPEHAWTTIATSPWTQWHASTSTAAAEASLAPISDSLLERARRILGGPESIDRPPSATALTHGADTSAATTAPSGEPSER
jgi:hypothetical protein